MNLLKKEPALTYGSIVAAIVAVASIFHIVVDPGTTMAVVATLAPIITALVTRPHVTPNAKAQHRV